MPVLYDADFNGGHVTVSVAAGDLSGSLDPDTSNWVVVYENYPSDPWTVIITATAPGGAIELFGGPSINASVSRYTQATACATRASSTTFPLTYNCPDGGPIVTIGSETDAIMGVVAAYDIARGTIYGPDLTPTGTGTWCKTYTGLDRTHAVISVGGSVRIDNATFYEAPPDCGEPGGTGLDPTCNVYPGDVGVEYLASPAVNPNGGTPPYSYSVESGALPDGLTLDSSTGAISGVPTTEGSFFFVIRVTDSTAATGAVGCMIAVAGSPALGCPTAAGAVGVLYTSDIPVTGSAPFDFWLSTGSLPDGLVLDSALGMIVGTPTVAGTFDFTVEVYDAAYATASAECSITTSGTGPMARYYSF